MAGRSESLILFNFLKILFLWSMTSMTASLLHVFPVDKSLINFFLLLKVVEKLQHPKSTRCIYEYGINFGTSSTH